MNKNNELPNKKVVNRSHYYWITLVSFEIICWYPSVRISGGNCKTKQRNLSLPSVRRVRANSRPIFLSVSVISK